jgi:hypothetical protein
MKRFALALLFLFMPGICFASDSRGNFVVKGAGIESCGRYVAEMKARSPAFFLFRIWLKGYLTAYDQFKADTNDIVPGASIDALSAELAAYCKRMPNQPFNDAALGVIMAHKAKRAKDKPQTTASKATAPRNPGRDTIRHLQQALKSRGYYKSAVDGSMGPATQAAIESYQKAENLPVTGQPDAATMAKIGG